MSRAVSPQIEVKKEIAQRKEKRQHKCGECPQRARHRSECTVARRGSVKTISASTSTPIFSATFSSAGVMLPNGRIARGW